MSKNLKILISCLFIFQILIAANFELAHDEAYYWLFSKHLAWGYFDHPPMMALVIKSFSFLPKSEITVRFGFIILQFISVFLLLDLLPKNDRKVGVLLFFSFPLASYVGILALPDMPLLFFTALYCWLLKKYLSGKEGIVPLSLGVVLCGLLLSKYHGILLILFTLIAIPQLFKRKSFYLVTAITLILCLPHLLWQIDAEFATLKYHFLERPSASFSIKRAFEFIGVEILLAGAFAGPLVWWITLKNKTSDTFERALKFISFGTVIFFLISTFTKKVEANWTVFLAIPLIILSAPSSLWKRKWANAFLVSSFAFVVGSRLLFITPSDYTAPKRAHEFKGWKNWANEIKASCSLPILANTYQIASKLSFYLELPIHAQNFQSRKNQFDFWPKDKAYYQGDEVCYLSDKKQFSGAPLLSPDGKQLYLVQSLSLKHLESPK